MMADRDLVCDYVIHRVRTAGASLNLLKLQKLLYYIQAWALAFDGKPLFPGRFQAWVHGPVNRELYDRFLSTKSLYSEVGQSDIRPNFDPDALLPETRDHIDTILDTYAGYTGTQLEEMTHAEAPWINARNGYTSTQRCEVEIDEELMASFYRSRLKK